MFETKKITGNTRCDDCKKVLEKNVQISQKKQYLVSLCPVCSQKREERKKEAAKKPLSVGDKVVFGIGQRMCDSGKVKTVFSFDGSHRSIAKATYNGHDWHIYIEELTNPIGGKECWTRKTT